MLSLLEHDRDGVDDKSDLVLVRSGLVKSCVASHAFIGSQSYGVVLAGRNQQENSRALRHAAFW